MKTIKTNFIGCGFRAASLASVLAVIGLMLLPTESKAVGFTPGDLVVYRVGDGGTALSSGSAAVFLDEYSPTGTLVQSIPLPTATTAGTTNALTAAGNSTSEGMLNFSTNGKYLAVTGYNTGVGTTAVSGTTPATVNRVVDVINPSTGTVTSSTLLNDPTGNIRSGVVSNDGTSLYITSSSNGVRYITAASGVATTAVASTQLSTTTVNLRDIVISNGQLYTTASSGATRIATVGTGTPTTTGNTITNLTGISSTNSTSPYQFAFATLGVGATSPDTLYVADNTTAVGIQKYSLVSGSWTLTGNIGTAALEGLTLSVTGTTVNIYATSGSSILSTTDGSGYGGTLSGTLTSIATASTNEAFRGISFDSLITAVPEPSTVLGSCLIFGVLVWSRRRQLSVLFKLLQRV